MPSKSSSLKVADIVVRDLVTVSPDDSLEEALALLVENRVSALPVVTGNRRCVGVLSGTDLLNLTRELDEEIGAQLLVGESGRRSFIEQLAQDGLGTRLVKEVMTSDVVSVGRSTPVAQAAGVMVASRVHRLIVVDSHDKLVGIVSTMDLLAAFAEEFSDSSE